MTEKLWIAADTMFGISQKQRDKFKPRLRKKHNIDFMHQWQAVVAEEDGVILLGNVAGTHPTEWFELIQSMPGKKVLFISELEQNRPKWYYKYGFEKVISFGQGVVIPSKYGNVLFSALPCKTAVSADGLYHNQIMNLGKVYDRYSCILNIHGFSNGHGNETNNSFDASISSIGNNFLEYNQIIQRKFG